MFKRACDCEKLDSAAIMNAQGIEYPLPLPFIEGKAARLRGETIPAAPHRQRIEASQKYTSRLDTLVEQVAEEYHSQTPKPYSHRQGR